MNLIGLSIRQFRFEFRTFFRNRSGMIFTLAFPILFMLIFGLNAKGSTESFNGHKIPIIQFFVPGIIAYGVIGATYTSLAMRLINLRDQGVLKRVAGTPLPRACFIAGQILNSVVIGVLIAIIVLVLGMAVYGVHFYAHTLLAVILAVVIGSATFCALAIAVASVIPNADAGMGIVQFTIFPVLFISDIFYSISDAPSWLGSIANFLPVRHLANQLQLAFDPRTKGLGIDGKHLLILAVWGLVGTVYGARHFRWESKTS